MIQSKVSKATALSFGVLAMVFLIGIVVLAWTEPSLAPPGGNVPAPINVGSTAQTKTGDLNIGGGLKYWITKVGDSFALKNNAGNIKFIVGQDGSVGIGIFPAYKLDVNGFLNVRGNANICHLVSYTATSGATYCPSGYYSWSGVALASGQILCCKVDNPL